jgi:hypothetical protein
MDQTLLGTLLPSPSQPEQLHTFLPLQQFILYMQISLYSFQTTFYITFIDI